MLENASPFLRWAGSKRKLIPQLSKYWMTGNQRYVEPFMGSACLFFALQPKTALLSDINTELVDVYISLKSSPEMVHTLVSEIPKGEDSYYQVRAADVTELNPVQKAARFIFLNRYCFNGLYRTNQKGRFNVPFGSKSGALPTLEQLNAVAKSLENVQLESGDFEHIIRNEVRAGDFVYLDPPYAIENQRIFNQYGPSTFGLSDLERLKDTLDYIHSQNAFFVLSYADCEEVIKLLKKWNFKQVEVQRNIAGFAKHRRNASELLFSNISLK